MGAHIVELLAPSVECTLFGLRRELRTELDIGLHVAVHSLVSSVVLGTSGTRAHDANAECYPPTRELRQATTSQHAHEWRAVVALNRPRNSVFSEEPLELPAHPLHQGPGKNGRC